MKKLNPTETTFEFLIFLSGGHFYSFYLDVSTCRNVMLREHEDIRRHDMRTNWIINKYFGYKSHIGCVGVKHELVNWDNTLS